MKRLPSIAAAVLLAGCTTAQTAALQTSATKAQPDITAALAKAQALCTDVAPLVTLGSVALALSGTPAPALLGQATAVADKCVVVASAARDVASGSLSTAAIALLSSPQALTDLASDVAAVKEAIKAPTAA